MDTAVDERKACLAIIDSYGSDPNLTNEARATARLIAAAIRNREPR
jgi:hypothetical protein